MNNHGGRVLRRTLQSIPYLYFKMNMKVILYNTIELKFAVSVNKYEPSK